MPLSAQKVDKLAIHWFRSARHSWDIAGYLFQGKKNDACLFFAHLAIEKFIKGLAVIKTSEFPPHIHDLVRLSALAGLSLDEKQLKDFREITDFNTAGRYEDEKYDFYKKCTPTFTKKWLDYCEQYVLWLEKLYPKK